MATYRIVKFYRDPARPATRTGITGLTLEEAQAHCQRPDTRGGFTCPNGDGALKSLHCPKCGAESVASWFDGYTAE